MASQPVHVPVLLAETMALFAPVLEHGWVVDGTCGLGGHTEALLKANPKAKVVGIDQDPKAQAIARARLSEFGDRFRPVRGNFSTWQDLLKTVDVHEVSGVLLDLGFSSMQIEDPTRGFSFHASGPLDMRMNPDGPVTAWELLRELDVKQLADIFYRFGDEQRSFPIARALKEAMHENRMANRASDVAEVIRKGSGYVDSRKDPSTRVFQALRIAVNRELESLEQFLNSLPGCLLKGGRIGVISFHSLEDRLVKRAFRNAEAERETGEPGWGKRLHSKGVEPSMIECQSNPRARSARLRTLERV